MSCACGPDWIPEKIVHLYLKVPKGEPCFFHEACTQHDFDYEEGTKDRASADFDFLVMMLKLAVEKQPTQKQIFRAVGFFRFVRWFGWVSYYYLKAKKWLKR